MMCMYGCMWHTEEGEVGNEWMHNSGSQQGQCVMVCKYTCHTGMSGGNPLQNSVEYAHAYTHL
jgi:hypothetical protein